MKMLLCHTLFFLSPHFFNPQSPCHSSQPLDSPLLFTYIKENIPILITPHSGKTACYPEIELLSEFGERCFGCKIFGVLTEYNMLKYLTFIGNLMCFV
jgi:hypothetical protein